MIHTGDCIEVMRTLPADSVDAVVTDPPAGISFMSKHWDRDKGGRTEWVAWMTEVMRECYRVLKPGGYAVVWSLPRTCHWTAWAMEDAGFIIRDQLAHIFASGFPKGKAQLKPAREDWWLARKPGPLRPLGIDAARIGTDTMVNPAAGNKPGGAALNMSERGMPRGVAPSVAEGRWPSNVLLSDPALFDEPNPEVVGSGATTGDGRGPRDGVRGGHKFGGDKGENDTLEGHWHGDSGGYSRFFRIPERARHDDRAVVGESGNVEGQGNSDRPGVRDGGVLPDDRVDYARAFLIPKSSRADREPVVRGQLPIVDRPNGNKWTDQDYRTEWPDGSDRSGSVHRQRANVHPTCKPTDLMRHLIRLVTPSGGVVLDPFLGSGTTAIAAELEGFPWIGIEKEPEYVAIAEARLNGTQRGLGLDVGAPVTRRGGKPTGEETGKPRTQYGFKPKTGWFGLDGGDSDEEPAA